MPGTAAEGSKSHTGYYLLQEGIFKSANCKKNIIKKNISERPSIYIFEQDSQSEG